MARCRVDGIVYVSVKHSRFSNTERDGRIPLCSPNKDFIDIRYIK